MAKTAASHRRWTLLMVADSGRMVPIRHAGGWLIFLSLVVVAALVAASLAIVLYLQTQDRRRGLEAELGQLHARLESLNRERELLMERLTATRIEDKSRETEAVPDANGRQGSGAMAADAPPPIGVEALRIEHDAATRALRLQFKLVNLAEGEETISGDTFVVLKNPSLPESQWQVLPPAALRNGKPEVPGKGRDYTIARFNTIEFSAAAVRRPSDYSQAAVLVYNADGRLIFEKEFPVDLSSD